MRVREKRCTCREGGKRNQKYRGKDKRREGEGGGVGVGHKTIQAYHRFVSAPCVNININFRGKVLSTLPIR